MVTCHFNLYMLHLNLTKDTRTVAFVFFVTFTQSDSTGGNETETTGFGKGLLYAKFIIILFSVLLIDLLHFLFIQTNVWFFQCA